MFCQVRSGYDILGQVRSGFADLVRLVQVMSS
jgi:hypothetical protein